MDRSEQSVARREVAVGARERAVSEREAALEGRETAVALKESWVTARMAREDRAVTRDETSEHRDAEASGRDRAANVAPRDASADTLPQVQLLLAAERALASADRSHSASDRRHAAADREAARVDRRTADADRRTHEDERDHDTVDELTGALRRGPGFRLMETALVSARRSEEEVVLGFVDVVGLKMVNDTLGHAAGDLLLADVARTLTTSLRSGDVVTRVGGDEFVCLLVGVTAAHAERLLVRVHSSLAQRVPPGAVTVGLAVREAGENLDALVARADADLYRQRRIV